MKRYKQVYERIIKFLYNSQVIAINKEIILENGIGVLKTRLIRGDKKKYTYYLKKKDQETIYVSLNKDFKEPEIIKKMEYFRTDFSKLIGKKPIKTEKVKHISKKLKAVNGMHILGYRVITYFLKTQRLKEIPNLVKFFHNELFRQKEGDLSKTPGITWRLDNITEKEIKISCVDLGGIYDHFINDEGTYYPSQVPGDYYSDGYSAFCFAQEYLNTKNKKYLDASIAAINFVIKHYKDYKPTRIVWPHKDFKNLPIIETYELLKNSLNKEQNDKISNFIEKMDENFYESTNVFALKGNWRYLRKINKFEESEKRINYCIQRVKKEQTSNGLIKDNFYIYHNSRDLTYHLYTLGFLANLAELNYPKIEEILLDGCNFSLNLTSSDGEVSYLGRGCNNIYQMAASIYAFETASRILIERNPKKSNQFSKAAKVIFKNIAQWQTKKGFIPNSLNKYGEMRLAWNHCETPYNAQSAYFLIKADKIKNKEEKNTLLPLEKDSIIDFKDSGYIAFANKKYSLVIFSGTTKSFAWSGGKHFNGLPGIALLCSKKGGTLTPILDEANNQIPLTDIPYKKLTNLYRNNKIEVIKLENFTKILFTNKEVTKEYICKPDKLIQISKNKTRNKLISRSFFSEEKQRININKESIINKFIKIKTNGFKVYRKNIPNPRGYKNLIIEKEMQPKEETTLEINFN